MDVSVVISTYNRARLLRDTLQSICDSAGRLGFEWEIVVVDNNSDDDTRRVVERASSWGNRIRYVFEPKQGVSFGRNTGVRYSRGKVLLITDDDVLVGKNWLGVGFNAFQNQEVAFIMGRILPLWEAPKPAWLPQELTGPIACCDLGDSVIHIERGTPHLPMTANMGIRRNVFEHVGGLDTRLGPRGRQGGHGGGDDYEFGLRLTEAGYRGIYLPDWVVHNRINAERLTRGYFRRWMFANGQAYSLMGRNRERHLRRWFGVPRYLFRRALRHAVQWVGCIIRAQTRSAFLHELHLRAFVGFVSERWTGGV